MVGIIIFNIYFFFVMYALFKGVSDMRYKYLLELKRMENEERIVFDNKVPIRNDEVDFFNSMKRSERRKVEIAFKKKVKSGKLVYVTDSLGNSGYVTKEEYLLKNKK